MKGPPRPCSVQRICTRYARNAGVLCVLSFRGSGEVERNGWVPGGAEAVQRVQELELAAARALAERADCGRDQGRRLDARDPSPSHVSRHVRSAQSRRRCGWVVSSPGADVAAASPVPVQMWQRRAQSRCRCGRDEPIPGADVAGLSPVPVQMWQRRAQSRCRCGRDEPGPGADVGGMSPVPAQMWLDCIQSRRRCGSGKPTHVSRHVRRKRMPHIAMSRGMMCVGRHVVRCARPA